MVHALDSTEREIRLNILDRMGIPSTTIGTEKTVKFIENDGGAFYIVPSGEKITFTVNLNPSASAELGYVRNSDSKVKTYSGYHKFYITNKSSGSVTVTGGSLTFWYIVRMGRKNKCISINPMSMSLKKLIHTGITPNYKGDDYIVLT